MIVLEESSDVIDTDRLVVLPVVNGEPSSFVQTMLSSDQPGVPAAAASVIVTDVFGSNARNADSPIARSTV